MQRSVFFWTLSCFFLLFSSFSSALYNSLDPKSVAEALAFYELYPETEEGKNALARAVSLLQATSAETLLTLPTQINRLKGGGEELSEQQIVLIESLASHLPNRKLKGYQATTEEEMLALPSEEIDLGKGLILSQLGAVEGGGAQARSYSAMLDLMALQILARLPKGATPLEKIQETNRFIFDQMHFRFPPHSVYTENIDLYTFLPSVMDNHLGVCLGVTALYLAIAQRIDLPLEIITPPGHIYVRYREGEKIVNIETTARGIHMPDETYLSLQNSTLQLRSLKEVIGMTHVNQASTYLYKGEYPKAVQAYEKGRPYMPEDPLIKELLGYSYLFTEKKEEGERLLKEVGEGIHSIAEDYLAGKVGLDGIEAVFMIVDENRDSLLCKQKKLEEVVKKYPEFRDGLHQLAVTWIQLNRCREAIDALLRYDALDPKDATTAYYLAVLHGQRQDFKNCWRYLKQAEKITSEENFSPKALRELRRSLAQQCPD
jgi:tetratricopeptide (TPR) repeat protein